MIEQRENCKAGSKLFPSEEIFFMKMANVKLED